jgi:hypothetical protein
MSFVRTLTIGSVLVLALSAPRSASADPLGLSCSNEAAGSGCVELAGQLLSMGGAEAFFASSTLTGIYPAVAIEFSNLPGRPFDITPGQWWQTEGQDAAQGRGANLGPGQPGLGAFFGSPPLSAGKPPVVLPPNPLVGGGKGPGASGPLQVSEPSVLFMMGLGLLLLGFGARRLGRRPIEGSTAK